MKQSIDLISFSLLELVTSALYSVIYSCHWHCLDPAEIQLLKKTHGIN